MKECNKDDYIQSNTVPNSNLYLRINSSRRTGRPTESHGRLLKSQITEVYDRKITPRFGTESEAKKHQEKMGGAEKYEIVPILKMTKPFYIVLLKSKTKSIAFLINKQKMFYFETTIHGLVTIIEQSNDFMHEIDPIGEQIYLAYYKNIVKYQFRTHGTKSKAHRKIIIDIMERMYKLKHDSMQCSDTSCNSILHMSVYRDEIRTSDPITQNKDNIWCTTNSIKKNHNQIC